MRKKLIIKYLEKSLKYFLDVLNARAMRGALSVFDARVMRGARVECASVFVH